MGRGGRGEVVAYPKQPFLTELQPALKGVSGKARGWCQGHRIYSQEPGGALASVQSTCWVL